MTLRKKILICFLFLGCLQYVPAQWRKQSSNNLAWLHSVYFINQNKGWIVGSQGTFSETSDGGKTWKSGKKFTEDTIRDVYFADENHGWILCERNIYSTGTLSPSYISETFDGGANWEKVKFDGEGKERLVRFFFTRDGIGWAVGESGTVFEMQSSDKKVWKKADLPVHYLMLDGSFTDQSHGTLVGGNGTALFTEDGGNTWKPAAFINKTAAKLNSVFFINRNIGWAVGAQGRICTTANGGKFWREQNSTVKADLSDVFFLSTAEGWAIGDSGTILHTTTAGNIWNEVPNNAGHKLERVFFIGKKGWAVGFGGTILIYDPTATEKAKPEQSPTLQKRNYSVKR